MGNTHGKKYYESVKKENESHEVLRMLCDITSKGREEKNLVQYGKKTKIQGNDNKDIPMAFHHIISANLLKEFIYKLSYDALNHQDKAKSNQYLELLNKIMFKSVVKYCQDYEYFFGFRLDEKGNYNDKGWKFINFLTPLVNNIKKEVEKSKNDVKKEVSVVDNSAPKDQEEKFNAVMRGFSDIMNKEEGIVKYLNDYKGLEVYIDKWKDFKNLDQAEQLALLQKINDTFLGKSNVQDDRQKLVKLIKPLKIGDLFQESSNKSVKYKKMAELVSKKTPIRKSEENIDFASLENSFEVNAKYIIGNEKYDEINKMKDLMIQYLQNSGIDNKFYESFSKIIENDYKKFNQQNWQFVDVVNQKSEKQNQAKKNNATKNNISKNNVSKNDNEILLNNPKELTKDWNSEGFSDLLLSNENEDMSNDFLSQIDAFVDDFIEKHGCDLGHNPRNVIVNNISSSLLSIFIWLPYNIFEGPRDRIDDPSNKSFENSGWKIIQEYINKAKEVRNIDNTITIENIDTNTLKERDNINTPIKKVANVNNPQTPEVKKRDFSRILNSDSKTQQKTKKFDNENLATPTKSIFNTPTKLKFNDENSESKTLKIKSFSKFISNSDSKDSGRQYDFGSKIPSNKIRVKFDSLFSGKNSLVKNH